jgi:transposase
LKTIKYYNSIHRCNKCKEEMKIVSNINNNNKDKFKCPCCGKEKTLSNRDVKFN